MKPLLTILLVFAAYLGLAQEQTGEDDNYVPFGLLMSDVIENVGQERIDAIDRTFDAIGENTTDVDYLSIPTLHFLKARELAFMGKYDEALEIAQEIKNVSPTIVSNLLPESRAWAYSLGYVTQGFVSWLQKDVPLARTYLDSANMRFKDGFYANYYLGWIAQNEDDNNAALAYYSSAENGVTVIKYDWAQLHHKKGVIYHGMKVYSKAVDEYTKSIQKFPLCKAYLERGKVYYFSAAYQDKSLAYEEFRKIIENCSDASSLGVAHSFVAEDFYYQKQNQKALENYKKAYELLGRYSDAGSAAMVYYVLKDWNNTISWATKGISAAQKDPNASARAVGDFYFYRGYANWSLKRMDATVNDLLQARRLGHKQADQYLREYFNK